MYRVGDNVIIGKKSGTKGETLVAYAEIVGVNASLSFRDNKMFKVKDSLSRISEISEVKLNELK